MPLAINADVKILGVKAYQPDTDQRSGEIIAHATMELLQTWNCADSVINILLSAISDMSVLHVFLYSKVLVVLYYGPHAAIMSEK